MFEVLRVQSHGRFIEVCLATGIAMPRSFDDPASRRLDLATLDLAVDAPALRPPGGLGRLAHAWRRSNGVDEFMQPFQGIVSILVLTPVALCLDDDYSLRGDPLITQRKEPPFDVVSQRRRSDIEAQVDGARHLVDILTAGALRADGGPFQLVAGDADHGNAESRVKTPELAAARHSPRRLLMRPPSRAARSRDRDAPSTEPSSTTAVQILERAAFKVKQSFHQTAERAASER
jgi:hypothetical protein